jgi:dTDP-4-amino-4,6-dideoxy-D-galactose acyltransferase
VDAGDVAESLAAQGAGFRLVDVRVELHRPTAAGHAAVREHHEGDVQALRSMARVSHSDTRFYADPRFPRGRCDDLYEVWIRRSCDGWAQTVLVPDEGGTPAGYVTVHVDEAGQRGSIGLIAVAPDGRGRGVGETLVRGAVDWCHRRGLREILVVTQGRNVSAQRVFQRCGFRTATVGLWFHKWYSTSQAAAAT